jgi:hypothetical protein
MTCSRSVYLIQHYVFKFVNDLQQVGVLDTTLCVQVCQWLAAGRCTCYNIMCSSLSMTCSRSVYLLQHYVFKFVNDLQQVGVLDTTLCVQVCQWLAAGRCTWYNIMCSSLSMTCSRLVYLIQHYVINLSVTCGRSMVSCHNINEILLKVALSIITLTQTVFTLGFYVLNGNCSKRCMIFYCHNQLMP